jgi:hypothetical protein
MHFFSEALSKRLTSAKISRALWHVNIFGLAAFPIDLRRRPPWKLRRRFATPNPLEGLIETLQDDVSFSALAAWSCWQDL